MGLHYHHYQNDTGVTIVTPNVDINVDMTMRTQLEVRYNLDAVSAASFNQAKSKTHLADGRSEGSCWKCHANTDALSGATQTYNELRQGLKVGVNRIGKNVDSAVYYTRNQENDYTPRTGRNDRGAPP